MKQRKDPKKIRLLYKEYKTLQGDDPIFIGPLLESRISQLRYSERTMRQIVGLLKEFAKRYEDDEYKRNTRYAVNFVFSSPNENIGGPYLEIVDAVNEKAAAILAWNYGEITRLPVDGVGDEILFHCKKSVCAVRDRAGLVNKDMWSKVETDVIEKCISVRRKDLLDNYNLSWEEIDPSGCLVPIKGINAVVQDQIARFLEVPVTWLIKRKSGFHEDGILRTDLLGIVRANAEDVACKIGLDRFDSFGGIDLTLENGKSIHVTKSHRMYFSNIAAAWLIDKVRNDQSYIDRSKKVRVSDIKTHEDYVSTS